MRPGCTEFFCARIHLLDKGLFTAGHLFCNHIGRVGAGANHETIEHLLCRELVSLLEAAHTGARFRDDNFRTGRPHIVHVDVAVFECEETGHNLCGRGRIHARIGIAREQCFFIGPVNQKHTFGADIAE